MASVGGRSFNGGKYSLETSASAKLEFPGISYYLIKYYKNDLLDQFIRAVLWVRSGYPICENVTSGLSSEPKEF